MLEIQGEIFKTLIIVGDLINLSLISDKTIRQKINKDIDDGQCQHTWPNWHLSLLDNSRIHISFKSTQSTYQDELYSGP